MNIYPKDQQQKVTRAIASLEKNRQELVGEMVKIERQGMAHASPWWRDGKYLYLVYPMTNGRRKREYIGCDEARIKEALARIERDKEYQKLQKDLEQLGCKIGQTETVLDKFYEILGVNFRRSPDEICHQGAVW